MQKQETRHWVVRKKWNHQFDKGIYLLKGKKKTLVILWLKFEVEQITERWYQTANAV